MVPIFGKGESEGVGYEFDEFIQRFEQICKEHFEQKRAKAFAFIFYDFTNQAITNALEQLGAFAELDRLSGSKLSIFYIRNKQLLTSFNSIFREVFSIKAEISLPFILFLQFDQEIHEIIDLQIIPLEHDNPHFSFKELSGIIALFVARLTEEKEKRKGFQGIEIAKRVAKITYEEFVKFLIKTWYENNLH